MRCLRKSGWILFLVVFACHTHAQQPLADVPLKTLRGKIISFSSATQKDSLVLICFWSTSSDESISELNAINANYEKWEKATPFRLMAISTDEGGTINRVRPMVNANEWKFDVYTDIDGALRKALNSDNLPQSLIIKKDKVIYRQSGYERGSENYLFQKLQMIAAGGS